jgi:hypothetical protein
MNSYRLTDWDISCILAQALELAMPHVPEYTGEGEFANDDCQQALDAFKCRSRDRHNSCWVCGDPLKFRDLLCDDCAPQFSFGDMYALYVQRSGELNFHDWREAGMPLK